MSIKVSKTQNWTSVSTQSFKVSGNAALGSTKSSGAGIVSTPSGPISSGLILYLDALNNVSYPGSGTTWNDLSGNGYHATLYNSPSWNSLSGFTFNGSNQYGTVPTSGLIYGTSPRTLSAWWKTNTATNWQWAFSYGSNWYDGAACFVGSHYNNFIGGGWGFVDLYASSMSTSIWYNQTLTFDGSTAKLYVNGIQVASGARSWNTSQNKAYIGRQVNDNEFLDGGLKQILLYNRVLSAAEILQNYNVDSPRFS